MSFLKKHWRFTLPITVVVLCLIVGTFTLYGIDKPQEPKIVYAMPERSVEVTPPLNTGGTSLPTSTTAPAEAETESADTSTAADNPVDLEPLEECCEDESVLGPDNKNNLSPEEREKRIKFVNDYFEELARDFEHGDADHEALFARVDELEEHYVAFIQSVIDLLSPESQRKFEDIANSDVAFSEEDMQAIGDELEVIGEQLGIPIHDYVQNATSEFRQQVDSLFASIDKLDDDEAQLIKEMEEFSN